MVTLLPPCSWDSSGNLTVNRFSICWSLSILVGQSLLFDYIILNIKWWMICLSVYAVCLLLNNICHCVITTHSLVSWGSQYGETCRAEFSIHESPEEANMVKHVEQKLQYLLHISILCDGFYYALFYVIHNKIIFIPYLMCDRCFWPL